MAKSASSFTEAKLTQKQFASSNAIACPNRLALSAAKPAPSAHHRAVDPPPPKHGTKSLTDLTRESARTHNRVPADCVLALARIRSCEAVDIRIKPRRKKFRMASDPFAIVRVKSPAGCEASSKHKRMGGPPNCAGKQRHDLAAAPWLLSRSITCILPLRTLSRQTARAYRAPMGIKVDGAFCQAAIRGRARYLPPYKADFRWYRAVPSQKNRQFSARQL
jgi:hypothetical protein